MGHDNYVPVPSEDGPGGYAQDAELQRRRTSRCDAAKRTTLLSILTIAVFVLGFTAGNWHGKSGEGPVDSSDPVQQEASVIEDEGGSDELSLPPQAFVPDCEFLVDWINEGQDSCSGVRMLTQIENSPYEGSPI